MNNLSNLIRKKRICVLFLIGAMISSANAYYQPESGRFMQRDTVQYKDSMNLYEYLKSNAQKYTDPDGRTISEPWPPTPPVTMPIEPIEEGLCKKIMKKWKEKRNEKAIELALTFLGDVLPANESMPHQHCVWNCRMTIRKGREYAEKMSKIKEEMDNIYADWGLELKNAGCWPELSESEQTSICHNARSADQPSDYKDNESGVQCGEEAVRCTKYPTAAHGGPRYSCPSLNGPCKELDDYCRACCTKKGVGPNTCDGPPLRPFGPRVKDFPECDSHVPGPGTGCDGTGCRVNQTL